MISFLQYLEEFIRIAVDTIPISPLAMKKEWEAIYGGILIVLGIVLLMKILQCFQEQEILLLDLHRY